MRTLSSTLLAAQKAASGTPYIKVEAKDRIATGERELAKEARRGENTVSDAAGGAKGR